MDIKDFDNLGSYKLIIPITYIINWILMIIGPIFYPVNYQVYAFIAKAYLAAKSVHAFVNTIIGFIFANAILNNISQAKIQKNKP